MREKRKRPCLCRERRKKECENRMEERTVWRAESARSSGCLQQWASTKWKMESSFSSLHGFPRASVWYFPLPPFLSIPVPAFHIHTRSFFLSFVLPSPILEKPEPTTTQSNVLVLCAWTCVTRLSLSLYPQWLSPGARSFADSFSFLFHSLIPFPFLSFFRFLDSQSFVWW